MDWCVTGDTLLTVFELCLFDVYAAHAAARSAHEMYAHTILDREVIEFAPRVGLSAPLYGISHRELVRPSASRSPHHLGCPGSVSSAGAISLKSVAKSFQRTWLGLGTSA